MPIYEYECQSCGMMYEILHIGAERTEDVICPKCGSREYKKWFSTTNIASGESSAPSCADGSCGMRNNACSDGMCPLD